MKYEYFIRPRSEKHINYTELICPGLVPAEDAKHIREILRTLREDEAQTLSHIVIEANF